MAGRQGQVTGGLAAIVLLVVGVLALDGGDGGQRIGTEGAIVARAGATTIVEMAAAVSDPPATTSSTAAPSEPATAPVAPPTTLRRPVASAAPAAPTTTVPAPAAPTSTTLPAPAPAPAPLVAAQPATTTSSTVPATTTTTVEPCRNSTDPACGPFRFDPQPGADTPMTVEVTVAPATPVAGQPMVFHVTLTDPDGVSYNGTTFNYGNGGVAGSTPGTCAKHGPWNPPARDPASAVKAVDVGHTYFEAGTYSATFLFDAGPFDCTDSVTGRGDRPYASSATATVTVTVAAS